MVDCAATKDRVCPRQNSAILLVEGYIWLHILCRRVWAVVEKVMVKGSLDGWMDGWMEVFWGDEGCVGRIYFYISRGCAVIP